MQRTRYSSQQPQRACVAPVIRLPRNQSGKQAASHDTEELEVEVLEERIAPGITLNRCETLLSSD